MMNTLHISLSIALLAVSIFISGLSADLARAENSVPKSMVILTPEENAWLKAHPNIQLGYNPSFEPTVIVNPDGSYEGIVADFLDALNMRLGTHIELQIDPVQIMHEKAKTRETDGIILLHPNYADKLGYLKTHTYYRSYPIVFGRAGDSFNQPDDFAGKKVVIIDKIFVSKKIIEPYKDRATILQAKNALEGLQMVHKSKADLFIGFSPNSYLITKHRLFGITPKYVYHDLLNKFGMAIRPDWPELVSILNKGISSFSEREIDTIISRWIDIPVREKIFELTPEEQAWLAKQHTVRVRIVDHPPYQIVEDNKPPQGIVIEYLKLIEDRTGIKFKYEVTDQPFAEFIESMKRSQGPDMTALIMPTLERKLYLSFTEPYLSSPFVVFIREKDKPILDFNGLTEKTVAIPRGVVVHEQLEKNYPKIKLALFDSDKKALEAVATGQANAYIGNLTVASHIIHQNGLTHLKVTATAPFGNQKLSMGSSRDLPELNSIIDKALASVTEEEKTAIRNKYLAIKFGQGINKAEVLKWALIFGGAAACILLLFLFWNRKMSREIGKRKKSELAFKQAKDEAEAANRSKSLFLANMSHELRTPLNVILGFSGMLSREGEAASDIQEKMAIINRSGQHLLTMINDVLDLSKIEAETIQLQENPFDLVALIKEISVMIQSRAAEKGVSVVVEAETVGFPYVKSDIGKLRQILINLLSNAVKFTDEGGVTIRCAAEPIADNPKDCHIVIEIEDTGPGIDPVRQAQIFEPFVQGINASVHKGTGLGLAISKKFAEIMGGTIELESELGKGSLFRVRLPTEIAEAADVKIPVDDRPRVTGLAPAQKAFRILVADDNRENLLLLKSLLEEVGFFVIEAKNGKEALKAYKSESPDLIWMDMRMPVMDGYEAVRQIRMLPRGDKLPIIAITASAFSEQREEILTSGCDDMVIKPFQAHEIFETIARFLGVEYVYEEPDDAAAPIDGSALTADMIAKLPAGLLQDLDKTTLVANREAILEVVERIAEHAPDIAVLLRTLAQNFEIERIRDLLAEAG